MRKPDSQTLFLGIVVVGVFVLGGYLFVMQGNGQGKRRPNRLTLNDIPFDGKRSYEHLKAMCALGARYSGSPGMKQQQEMLIEHFRKLGGEVELQQFKARHPLDGSAVPMANLIVRWHPQRKQRVLVCAHYDTRPFPDSDPDPRRRRGLFVGANDGASGTAVLCELAHHMGDVKGSLGVDFVLFDGEELVYDSDRDPFFLGSTHFAREYKANPPGHRYKYGVLLDMVGDRELHLYQEINSRRYAPTVVQGIWDTADRLGVREFVPRTRHEVRDDHLPLNQIAGIPTADVIDFDYPRLGNRSSYWHTTLDVPEKCSALSLAKVGWVISEWLKSVE